MIRSTDQLNRAHSWEHVPKRIVSVVPSQTEFLFDIGLDEHIVGITKFCIHPQPKVKGKELVGGTKNLNIEKILALQPDIIIANKEENERGQIEELMKHVPVWISDIYTLEDAYSMMDSLGKLFQKEKQTQELLTSIKNSFEAFAGKGNSKRVAYFIWRKPYMLAGEHTFIQHLLEKMGLRNICFEMKEGQRYPEIDREELAALQPEWIYLSSEPYPFKEAHIKELQEICPQAKIRLVDGELFSWYGSRLLHSANYFQTLLNS